MRGKPACAILALGLLAFSSGTASSQSGRTIRLIVPANAGASTDFVARLSADHMSRTHGVTVVVENRPGAGGTLGAEAVFRAPPDGNTLLVTANTYLLDGQTKKANYHPVKDFEPICYLVETPAQLLVNSESPYRTLADLFNAARQKPGELSLAAVGPGSTYHLGMVSLTRLAGVNMTYVPYPGSAPATTALLGNHVTSAISGYAVVAPQVKGGKLRALATATAKRIEPEPEVPTLDELGFKNFVIDNWFGVVAPPKTPKDKLAELVAWFTAAIEAPESKTKLAAQFLYTGGPCGEQFGAYLRDRYDEYGRLAGEAGLKKE
jgi:tripartite-type tricarboxylate transporter receptor subunit TctC